MICTQHRPLRKRPTEANPCSATGWLCGVAEDGTGRAEDSVLSNRLRPRVSPEDEMR